MIKPLVIQRSKDVLGGAPVFSGTRVPVGTLIDCLEAGDRLNDFLKDYPSVRHSPGSFLWSSYDSEGDVLYINFKKPSHATDSELTDNDIIVRYDGKEIVGVTILNARKYKKKRILRIL